MITTSIEYEDKKITLARPTLADGRVRRQIWGVMKETGKDKEQGAQAFGYFITQLVVDQTEGLDFTKMSVFPGADEVTVLYEKFVLVIDEALSDLLIEKVSILNGYFKPDQMEKKVSAPSSNGTSEVEVIPIR